MTKEIENALLGSLGSPNRDFKSDPLTQEEIHAIVFTYSNEIKKPDLEPELKEIYQNCVNFLKNHLIFH